ncbi:MAG: DUF4293 domain-containing protein [Bacteroidota bacterium]
MIQRIQTLLLAGVTIISILLFFIPFVEYSSGNVKTTIDLLPGHTSNIIATYYIPVVFNIINLILSVAVILQFKKRLIQIKMASLLMAFSSILLGTMLVFDFVEVNSANNTIKLYLYGAYLSIISILLSFFAIRRIKKDEELVRSADRLR